MRGQTWFGLTHWGRMTHICVSKVIIIGSDNGLSPGRRQAIIWTNAGILLIRPLETNFSEILIGVQTFSFRKMELKMSSICLGRNELNTSSCCWRNDPLQCTQGLTMYAWTDYDLLIMYKGVNFCEINIHSVWVNSLAPGRCGNNFKSVIFKLTMQTSCLGTFSWVAQRWMPQNLTNEKSTLVMWRHQAITWGQSQCWPRSMVPYGITMPQWVNELQCSGLSWKSCRSWPECWEIQTSICKEMCKKLLVLTKSCWSRTDGPALVSNTDELQ